MERGLQKRLLEYMQQNAERHVTNTEIADALNITPTQASNAAANLVRAVPSFNRVGRGLYLYDGKPAPKRENVMLIQILKDDGEKKLVIDEENEVWTMRKLADY